MNSIDLFDNNSQEAYLSILIRQPIGCGRLFPQGTEALIAVRNLLAEGYRPFLTPDGNTLYFAQADRSIQAERCAPASRSARIEKWDRNRLSGLCYIFVWLARC